MPKKLKSFDFNQKGTKVITKWDKWLDGDIWEFVQGQDFNGKPQSFRALFYSAARHRNLKIRSKILKNKIVIQAFKEEEKEGE